MKLTWFKKTMPVKRPQYVDAYLEELAGPNEQHAPEGGWDYDLVGNPDWGYDNPPTYTPDPEDPKGYSLNPGAWAHAGLTVKQMGDIGAKIVLRLGELPGIGAITPASDEYNFPIDAIVQGSMGNFGCEIKTNHSQAQERFKLGGKTERLAKIQYCYENGLKPALIGVRLNFYTNLAYIFFREGMTDTWIGNSKMQHVGTFNFEDINPFRSSDPEAQALAVDNAHIPDQSESDDEFAGVFGMRLADTKFEEEHPRDTGGKFTAKEDLHEIKVKDSKGKHLYTMKRCKHCGVPYGHPGKGRVECPSCGEDPERDLKLARVVLGDGADDVAKELGFMYHGRNSRGHRQYKWADQTGLVHIVGTGSGAHGKRAADIDAQRVKQRMNRCIGGQCLHGPIAGGVDPLEEPSAPLIKAGQTVTHSGRLSFVHEIDGGMAWIFDNETGQEDIVPVGELKSAAAKPDYLYVYYMSELHVVPYKHNVRHENLLEELLDKFGVDMGNTMMDIDPTKVDGGNIYTDGNLRIEHKQLSDPDVRDNSEKAIRKWWKEQKRSVAADEWLSL